MSQLRVSIKNENNLPRDTPSKIEWIGKNHFAVSSWDGSFKIFELAKENSKMLFFKKKEINFKSPIIDFQFVKNCFLCLIGFLDGSLILLELSSFKEKKFSKMSNPILKILACEEANFFLVFDYSRNLEIFKINNEESLKYEFNKTIIDADISDNMIACVFEDGDFCITTLEDICEKKDLEYLNNDDERAAKKATCIRIDSQKQNLILGLASGRALIFKYKKSYTGKYSLEKLLFFRGHVKGDNLYNVNGAGFFYHKDSTFYTLGSEGRYKIWNWERKNLCTQHEFKAPVIDMSYNYDLNISAVVVGYDWAEGVWKFNDINYRPDIILVVHDKDDFYTDDERR